jgi:uridine phosphorylase
LQGNELRKIGKPVYNTRRLQNLLAVAMEAAGLYALAQVKGYSIACFAHVTNRMGVEGNDFEKGEADGNTAFRRLVATVAQAWMARP